jgi:hypothetical protein
MSASATRMTAKRRALRPIGAPLIGPSPVGLEGCDRREREGAEGLPIPATTQRAIVPDPAFNAGGLMPAVGQARAVTLI